MIDIQLLSQVYSGRHRSQGIRLEVTGDVHTLQLGKSRQQPQRKICKLNLHCTHVHLNCATGDSV